MRRFEPARGWQSPVAIPRRWLAVLFAACALFALGMGVFSSDDLHRLWGLFAAGAYLLAAVAVLAWRSARGVDLALILGVGGALAAPLSVLAEQGRWQPEVGVIARGARLMVHHGSPYLSDAVVRAAHDPNVYNPYLPVMAVFGIPRALFGPGLLTDPRVWFCVGFVVIFAAGLAVAGARDVVRWTLLVTATPVIAFSLAVGGTDVPVLALICLGLALLWRHPRTVLAGAVLGIAAATKATAWPALIVAGTMVLVRDGRRAAARLTAIAVVVACAIIVPVAALGAHALVDNTILFPLGLASVRSQAASPLPGHVLADTGPTGHLIAVSLLCLAGLGVLVSLVVRPPRTVPAATWRLIIGLVLMFTLAPATRFGYFMYPLGLWAWLEIVQLGLRRGSSARLAGAGPGRSSSSDATQPSPA
ncbi:MAG TPA: glycosyltransferase 87 family protein [Streptosporangiaceae bacterium]|nr:glycosyltransferase 87 family protein [Streptosporangiaceae bacterium]